MAADVSVVIPTYNRLWCLPKAVDSCRGTRCHTEIVVVDDGSEDGTWDWLQAQPDVVAVRQPNQGQTWAANHGVARSSGRYVRFLDSDDFLCSGIIDAQLAAADREGADLVYSRVDGLEMESGRVFEYPDPGLHDDFMAVQLGETHGGHFLGMVFKRWLVERVPHRPDFALRDDLMFILEVALLDPKLAYVPGVAGYWVEHGAQTYRVHRGLKLAAYDYQYLRAFERVLGELARRGRLTARRRRAAARVLWPLAHSIAAFDLDEGAEVAEWVFALDPEFRRPERGARGASYRLMGFRATQRLIAVRRAFRETFGRGGRGRLHDLPG